MAPEQNNEPKLKRMALLLKEQVGTGAQIDVGDSSAILEQLVERACLELAEFRWRNRLLIDRAVDVICIIDGNGRFAFVNESCEQAWGYGPAELKGKPFADVLASAERNPVADVLRSERSVDRTVFECVLRHKNGGLLNVLFTGYWSASESGIFCIARDLTQQKAFDRMRDEFLSMIYHDLRGPLANIKNMFELMNGGVLGQLTPLGTRVTDGVKTQCERMFVLLEDMLELDRIQSDAFVMRQQAVDMERLITNVAAELAPMLEAKRLTIEKQLSNCMCGGDEQRLAQVVFNLLFNAVKYAPEASVIRATISANENRAVIAIMDQGPGIPPDKVERIFQRFKQAELADAGEKSGFGLGLAICKAIVERHGGTIGVRNEPGKGCTFWFELPLVQQ